MIARIKRWFARRRERKLAARKHIEFWSDY